MGLERSRKHKESSRDVSVPRTEIARKQESNALPTTGILNRKEKFSSDERQRRASLFYLSGYEQDMTGRFDAYGKVGNLAKKVLHSARQAVQGQAEEKWSVEHGLNQLFMSSAFQRLSEKKKSGLLRDMLGQLQFDSVKNEAMGSHTLDLSILSFIQTQTLFEKEPPSSDVQNPEAHNMTDLMGLWSHSILYPEENSPRYRVPEDILQSEINHREASDYAFEELGRRLLSEFQKIAVDREQNARMICEFWGKNRHPMYLPAASRALSAMNPTEAGAVILEELKHAQPEIKRALGALLYRLELGQLGISKEGVRYFNKLYDLGELNNPDFFVNRLTANGDVGIFDEAKHLQGCFNLGDLTGNQAVVKAHVFNITRDMLFHKRQHANTDESLQQEKLLREFNERYFNLYNQEFFKQTGVAANNLSLREQAWFLHFIDSADQRKQERAIGMVRNYGEDALKAFLTLEYDKGAGDDILDLAEQTNRTFVRTLFRAHADILDHINDIEAYLRENVQNERAIEDATVEGIAIQLLHRARTLLASGVESAHNPRERLKLIQRLRDFDADNDLFVSACRELKNRGELRLEDIRDAALESANGETISLKDQETMRHIQKLRYGNKYPEKLAAELDQALDNALRSDDSQFFIYRKGNEIISYMRFDKQSEYPDGSHVHAASFMTDPRFEGGALGSALLELIIKKQREAGVTLHAECDPSLYRNLYQKMGFEFVREYKDQGVDTYEIILRPSVESARLAA